MEVWERTTDGAVHRILYITAQCAASSCCCVLARTASVQLASQPSSVACSLSRRSEIRARSEFAARPCAHCNELHCPIALFYSAILRNAVSLFTVSIYLLSVYPSVVFGIRQYILVFSLISSNFISVLSIFAPLAPLRKSAIYL